MKEIYSYAIKLVRYVLCDYVPELNETIDFEELFNFSKHHSIESMIYVGLRDLKVNVPQQIMTKFKEAYNGAIVYDTMQEVALLELGSELNEALIDYVLLKGSMIKNYYPMPDYRKSGDIDILVKPDDEPKILEIMEKLGYQSVEEFEGHDIHLTYQKPPYMTIEIHRQLVRSNNRSYEFCNNVWDNVHETEDNKHCLHMNNEFLYVYLIAHLAKHLYSGGAGIRLITDIWIMLEKFDLDNKKIEQYLEQANLIDINDMVIKLVNRLFRGDTNTDENILLLERIVFEGGSFGSDETRLLIDSNKGYKSRTQKFVNMLFPPAKALFTKYPILKKHTYLLPAIWIYRGFRLLIYKRDSVSEKVKNNFDTSRKNSAFDDIINAVRDK